MKRRVLPVMIALVVSGVTGAVILPDELAASAQAQAVVSTEPASTHNSSAAPPAEPMQTEDMISAATAREAGVTPDVLHLALNAVACAVRSGDLAPPPTLTLIDYSRPSTEPRLWVFDLRTGELRFHELVAHGKGTGDNLAQQFSDQMNSHQSSLGLFVTRDTYVGSNGYSLRLDGLEPGFNGRARDRAIVMHGAPYVDAAFAAAQGRLGRSWGCPALRKAVARQVIEFVRDGGVIFSYYPDQKWLNESRFLNCDSVPAATLAAS